MFKLEKELVAIHLGDLKCYNLREGGSGGWSFINSSPEAKEKSRIKRLGLKKSLRSKQLVSLKNRGKKRSLAFKLKASETARNLGTFSDTKWIKNDELQLNSRIAVTSFTELPPSWSYGRNRSYGFAVLSALGLVLRLTHRPFNSDFQVGSKNPSYGKSWVNNSVEEKLVVRSEKNELLAKELDSRRTQGSLTNKRNQPKMNEDT